MRNLNWDVELNEFHDVTPNKGELLFTNIIATNNPSASRFLVFACHYDSKMMNFRFIGATDSAVPCAMLIYFAKVLQRTLRNVQSVSIVVNLERFLCTYNLFDSMSKYFPACRFKVYILRRRGSIRFLDG